MNPQSGVAQAAVALAWRLVLVLAAAAALYVAWTTQPTRSDPGSDGLAVAGSPPPALPSDGTAQPEKTAYAAIAQQPLFYPSRKPWAPPPAPTPPPVVKAPPPLTKYVLVGVILSGQSRSALIRPPGAAEVITLEEGQNLEGWRLQEISRARLRFSAGDNSYDMTFPKPSESKR